MIENEQLPPETPEVESHVLDFQDLGVDDNGRYTCLASVASEVDRF